MPSITANASLVPYLLLSVSMIGFPLPTASGNMFRGGEEEKGWSTPDAPVIPKETRVIGGERAEEDRFPWAVSLQGNGGHFCGGSLIGKDTVLTAAHCVNGEGNNFSIMVGSDDVDEGQEIGVRKAMEHPDYDSGTEEYDMALVFLRSSTTLDIPLVGLNDDNSYPAEGSTTYTMGWGDTDPGDNQKLSDQLLITDVEIISNEECADIERKGESYGKWVYDDMICADTNGQDACQGDSGGPLITRGANAGSDVQVGVVSWGIGCAFLPGVYARVSKGYDWIRQTVCEESNDPPGSLCGTPEPTDEPTDQPTPNPTRLPTKQPTRFPTNQPTRFPTRFPTKQPTNRPTTMSPSASPTTGEPTMSPTDQPSLVPSSSSVPSSSPSLSPSVSSQPTSSPSVSPSISLSPSGTPSNAPSVSSMPSESPSTSFSPTIAPSTMPTSSQSPTISSAPTAMPSQHPSSQPSSNPSLAPSSEPSISPSMSPSTSSSPSSSPSEAPSLYPSNVPSITTSPTLSSSPTQSSPPSSMPSEEKSDLVIPGSSLLIADASALAVNDGEIKNSSNRTGNSLAVLGVLLSSFALALTIL